MKTISEKYQYKSDFEMHQNRIFKTKNTTEIKKRQYKYKHKQQ